MQSALLHPHSPLLFSTAPRLGEALISSRERYIFCLEPLRNGQGLLCNSQLAQKLRQNKRSPLHSMQMFDLHFKPAFVHCGPLKRKGMGAGYDLTLPWAELDGKCKPLH